MRTSVKFLAAIAAFGCLVAANEWHRTREREKQAEAYAEAVLTKSPRDWDADGIFPASMQTDIVRMANHELEPILDTEAKRAFAAKYFLVVWLPVGEVLPQACESQGVRIDAFRSAYEAIHREPLAKSKALLSYPHEDEAEIRRQVEKKLQQGVALQLQNRAASAGKTVADECRELNTGGAGLAARVNMAGFATNLYAALYAAQ